MLKPVSGRVSGALSRFMRASQPVSCSKTEKDEGENATRETSAFMSLSQSLSNTSHARPGSVLTPTKAKLTHKPITIRSRSSLRSRVDAGNRRSECGLLGADQSSLPANKSMPVLQLDSRPIVPVKPSDSKPKEKKETRLEPAANPIKSSQEKTNIISVLSKHYIFGNFSKTYIQKLASSMKLYKLPPNEIVFKRSFANFFVVASGAVEVVHSGKLTKTLVAGDCFGEMELINDEPRTAVLRTVEPSIFWGIDKTSFRPFLKAIKELDFSEKREFINSIQIFSELTSSQKDTLAAVLIPHEFVSGHKIVKEGDFGDLMYIIREGTVICYMKGVEIRRLNKGEFFGEQALLYSGTRAATVAAEGPVRCVSINRKNFGEVLNNYFPMIYLYTILNTFKKSPYLCHMPNTFVPRLISCMTFKMHNANKVAIAEGTPRGNCLWVVLRGSLFYSQSQKIVEFPSCIGDTDLPGPGKGCYLEDIRTSGPVVLAKLSRTDFLFCLGATIHQVNRDYDTYVALRDVQLFYGLDVLSLRELVLATEQVKYRNGEEIVEQNSPSDCFYIIKSGQAFIRKDGIRLRTITKNDFFGEKTLLSEEAFSVSVVAMVNVSCWVIKKPDLLRVMTPTIRQRLLVRVELQEEEKVCIKNLIHVKLLATSKHVHVHLVANRERPTLYVLKAVIKMQAEMSHDDNSEDSTREDCTFKSTKVHFKVNDNKELEALRIDLRKKAFIEKEMLRQISHPFVVKLLAMNEDEDRYNFLMEFVNGPTLQDVRTKVGVVNDDLARFYAATGLLVLEYLHERGIMHRNLDLTNIVVDADGYPKFVDFALAKFVNGRTYSIVGPAHCMAPEVIRRCGYSHTADYFSLGVMLYKFISGHFPFADDEVDPLRIYSEILKHHLVYPDDNDFSEEAISFIERLLLPDPKARFEGGIEALKSHEWFKGLNWDRLARRELRPPFIPINNTLANEIAIARTNNFTVEMIKEIEARIADTKKDE